MSDVYEKLRERLDMFPQGFPRTESRVEIEILRELFSPEEAEIMLFLRPSPEPPATVAERMGRDERELADVLYDMSRRGLILRFRVNEEQALYFLTPWVVGIWEFQIKNLTDEKILNMIEDASRREGFRSVAITSAVPESPAMTVKRMIGLVRAVRRMLPRLPKKMTAGSCGKTDTALFAGIEYRSRYR